MNYTRVLGKLSFYNEPVNVEGTWFLRSKGTHLGSKDSLFQLIMEETDYGLVPIWDHIGDVSGTNLVFSNEKASSYA